MWAVRLTLLLTLGCSSSRPATAPPTVGAPAPEPTPARPASKVGRLCKTAADCAEDMTCAFNGVGERRCALPTDAEVSGAGPTQRPRPR